MMQEACQARAKLLVMANSLKIGGKSFQIGKSAMQKFPFEADALKSWFRKEKRTLPWRVNPTPYAVWISEIMLQQTQVAVVLEYFLKWMSHFPNITALATAPLSEVIKLWEGLGYYSRARNIHAAAQIIVAKYSGKLPCSHAELLMLPGIGAYTAGAILSFAYHQKAAAVDGNVIRSLARYFGITDNVDLNSTRTKIWEIADNILPEQEPWAVTEGLIELGAMVCKKDPQCWACPIRSGCAAFRLEMQDTLPKRNERAKCIKLEREVFVICCRDEVLVKKVKEKEIMAGLYEFPYREKKSKNSHFLFNFEALLIQKLPIVEHSFTKYRAKLYPKIWQICRKTDLAEYCWVHQGELTKLPFSSGHKKIVLELEQHLRTNHAHTPH